ncbi:hypothetical protein acsn021_01930 [Anaerocolumna cellulosilytica]|uniref:Uncharacterized protein n=1 Tax=Anaerocolumna cellulosilytica TaxID=433286 RepID=A0A6S6QPY0_9FIRM|nr:hypothetical protein acsn021_01930 [Anaerocolumna cellulosilytica]
MSNDMTRGDYVIKMNKSAKILAERKGRKQKLLPKNLDKLVLQTLFFGAVIPYG